MILISKTAAGLIFAEAQRWVEWGLKNSGVPLESLQYPLSALVPRSSLLCPLELVSLEHIRELVVDHVAVPPDAIKSFSAANCHFAAEDMVQANHQFNATIDDALRRRPRLGVLSKLHAHPFLGGDFLSGGDLYHGVTAPKAIAWRHSRGLDTALLHVVYPDTAPALSSRRWRVTAAGARSRHSGGVVNWRIRTWGSTGPGEMADLGDALVVSSRHPSIRAARRLPYWGTRRGGRWCDAQKASLRSAGYAVSRNLLGRGWRRYLLKIGARHILLALPPDLPATPVRVIEIHDAQLNHFELLRLPPSLLQAPTLSGLSLPRIVDRL